MMHNLLRAASDNPLFAVTATPYLLLDTDLQIQAANPAYLRATGRAFEELEHVYMFDAFPDNPNDPEASGVRNLAASFERVLHRARPDDMGVQRYDIPDRVAPNGFRVKTWVPVNSPLNDADGHVVGLVHHVEDITVVRDLFDQAAAGDLYDGVSQEAAALRRMTLAVAGYERAASARREAASANGDRSQTTDPARRDALWHRIVHATRRSSPRGGCPGAICAAAVAALPAIDAATITLRGAGLLEHQLAASSPWAHRTEELHWTTGEGPSRTSFTTARPVLVSDLDHAAAQWPHFVDAARAAGVTAVFAYPLRTATAVLGTLTLYRRRTEPEPPPPPPLTPPPPADAQTFADIASFVLIEDMDTEIIASVRATVDRADIEIATGLVSEMRGISLEQARALLQALARSRKRTLADTARAILAERLPGAGIDEP